MFSFKKMFGKIIKHNNAISSTLNKISPFLMKKNLIKIVVALVESKYYISENKIKD